MPPDAAASWTAAPSFRDVRRTALLIGVAVLISAGTILDPFVTVLVMLGVLLAAPLLWRLVHRTPIHPLEPLWPFLICYAISFVLKPIIVVGGRPTYYWTNISRPEATVTVLWTVGALACVYLGYFSPLAARAFHWSDRLAGERSVNGLRFGAVVLALGGVAAMLLIVQISGMVPSLEDMYSERFRSQIFLVVYGRGYLTVMLTMCIFAPATQAYVALTTRTLQDFLLAVAVTVVVSGVVTAFYSRTLVLQVFITLLVVLHFKGKWFSPRMLTITGAALLVFGGALGLKRVGGFESLWTALASPFQALEFLTHSFDSFEFLAPAIQRTSIFGSLGGQSLIEDIFWTFMPRALVPWKPDEYGAVRVQNFLQPELAEISVAQSTFPAGFLSEWYVNYGIFGVVLISILYGIVLRIAREGIFTSRPKLLPLLIYGGIVLNLVSLFRSSSQLFIQAVVIVVILFLFFGRMAPGTSRRAPPRPAGA